MTNSNAVDDETTWEKHRAEDVKKWQETLAAVDAVLTKVKTFPVEDTRDWYCVSVLRDSLEIIQRTDTNVKNNTFTREMEHATIMALRFGLLILMGAPSPILDDHYKAIKRALADFESSRK